MRQQPRSFHTRPRSFHRRRLEDATAASSASGSEVMDPSHDPGFATATPQMGGQGRACSQWSPSASVGAVSHACSTRCRPRCAVPDRRSGSMLRAARHWQCTRKRACNAISSERGRGMQASLAAESNSIAKRVWLPTGHQADPLAAKRLAKIAPCVRYRKTETETLPVKR